MISYELAKDLKDAGFPLDPNRNWNASEWAWLPCDEITKNDREKLWIPSLEELIDEVKFHILQIQFSGDNNFYKYNNNIWTVFQKDINSDAFMSTDLDVALALLWLDLNKKKDA